MKIWDFIAVTKKSTFLRDSAIEIEVESGLNALVLPSRSARIP